jgi:hypothetical protein
VRSERKRRTLAKGTIASVPHVYVLKFKHHGPSWSQGYIAALERLRFGIYWSALGKKEQEFG